MPALTYNDVLSAYACYPAPIRPYLLRAETHPTLRAVLTKSFMRVFVDILARAPIADPSRALEFRVNIIARDLAVSTKTVTRTVNLMRENDWIHRHPNTDGRNNHGKFCAGEFVLSQDLRAMLGLPTSVAMNAKLAIKSTRDTDSSFHISQTQQSMPSQSTYQSPVDNLPDGTVNEAEISPKETEKSPGLYRVNKVLKKEASFKEAFDSKSTNGKDKPTKIPHDLIGLKTELKIRSAGIFKLMQIAKESKQRLQDIWIAKRDQILAAGATGGRAVNYLKFLLRCGEDFAYAAQKRALSSFAKPVTREPIKSLVDHRIYWNKKFHGADGLRVRIHGDGFAEITDTTRQDAYVRPADMHQIYDAIAAGKLWLFEE